MLSDISAYNWFNPNLITVELISDIIMNDDGYPPLLLSPYNLFNSNSLLMNQVQYASFNSIDEDTIPPNSFNKLINTYKPSTSNSNFSSPAPDEYNENYTDMNLSPDSKKRKLQFIKQEQGYENFGENINLFLSRRKKKWSLQADIWTISMNQNRSPFETWNQLEKSTQNRYYRLLSASKTIFGSEKYVQNPLYVYCPICLRRLRQATIADPVMANIFGKGHHIYQHQRSVKSTEESKCAKILLQRAKEYSTDQKCITPLPSTLKPPPPPGPETLIL
ncbi:hypothetical protein H8356DRAFT_924270 [Neocallimastix lanati (nom. inval.)]|nr:hypothetical protein H8356DRAFT_924270 [Neocallimastix sp. JGI-2020a]